MLRPTGVFSAALKCEMFCFIIWSCTSDFVVYRVSSFVRMAPDWVVVVSPFLVMFMIGSPYPLPNVHFIFFHLSVDFSFFIISWKRGLLCGCLLQG